MSRNGVCRLNAEGVAAIQERYRQGRWASVDAFCRHVVVSRSTYYELLQRRTWFEERTIRAHLLAFGVGEDTIERHYEFRRDDAALVGPDAGQSGLLAPLSSFVGRTRELADIKNLLAAIRMLTLTGAGGCGKTRLALRVAVELRDTFRDGVVVVELAAVVTPEEAVRALVIALRINAISSDLQAVIAYLRSRECLLVLDNCEQVIDACCAAAIAILKACPAVRILSTSREACHAEGETVWCVPPMSLPAMPAGGKQSDRDLAAAAASDAMALFLERARGVKSDFALTSRNAATAIDLCRQLDGMPLAIELAAACVRALPVDAIRAQLADRFGLLVREGPAALPHHQTLEACMAWSYERLSESERALLQRLSVFRGGWALDALEPVCVGGGLAGWELLSLLTSLVDKNLVTYEAQRSADRYRLLETVREYAADRLRECGAAADAVRERHLGYFLALCEEAESELTGAAQAHWLDRLEGDHDNLRAAFRWSLAQTDAAATGEAASAPLRFCAALLRFFLTHGHLTEGRECCAAALQASSSHPNEAAYARVLNVAGVLARNQGDCDAAAQAHRDSLDIYRGIGHMHGSAAATANLGLVELHCARYVSARWYIAASVALYRKLGNSVDIAMSLHYLGSVDLYSGDYGAARATLSESLALFRESNHRWGIAATSYGLSRVERAGGDRAAARSYLRETLALYRELGDQQSISGSLETCAALLDMPHDAAAATRLLGAADRLHEELGSPIADYDLEEHHNIVAAARGSLGDAAFASAWAEGRAMATDAAVELALERVSERTGAAGRP